MTYVVTITHRFFRGPMQRSLACVDDFGDTIARFSSRADALAWIKRAEERRYVLLHDESDLPTYRAVRASTAPAWAVAMGA